MTGTITIYHNPSCGTSRNALEAIRAAGHEPQIIDYRTTGWTRSQLEALFAQMRVSPRDVLREKGTPAAEFGLLDPEVTDDAVIDAMIEHPILVNRPIVVSPKGAKLCRPSDTVQALL